MIGLSKDSELFLTKDGKKIKIEKDPVLRYQIIFGNPDIEIDTHTMTWRKLE
jgi:hypothetical protein